MTIDVSGGAGGVGATYADLLAQAAVLDRAGDDVRTWSDDVAKLLLDPDILDALVLCPGEVATVELALASAATGPNGLLPVSVLLEGSALVLQGTVLSYEVIETTQQAVYQGLHAAGGFAVGLALPALFLGAGAGAGLLALTNPRLALMLGNLGYANREAIGVALGDTALETLFENPWLMEHATASTPWFVQGVATGLLGPVLPFVLSGGQWPTADYEHAVGGLVAGGQLFGAFRDERDFTVVPVDGTDKGMLPPDSVKSIFDQQADVAGHDGQVQISTVTHPDGTVSHVVQIPGTQDWSPTRTDNPVDLTTNVNLMSTQDTVMREQIAQAMRDAGIAPGDPVMLTGHSQGGIACAAMASDPAFREEFNVTSIVTGGSPIARFDIPDDVSVLAIEHDQDPVPMLEGRENPDAANWVTVGRDVTQDVSAPEAGGKLNPIEAHNTVHYSVTGAQIDTSSDPSVVAWREQNQDFFATEGVTADVRRYEIQAVS